MNQFFKATNTGPYKVRNFGCKQQEFAKAIEVSFQMWEADRQSRLTSASGNVAVAKDGLSEIRQEKVQANLKRARDKAQATLQQKRAKAEVKFNKADG